MFANHRFVLFVLSACTFVLSYAGTLLQVSDSLTSDTTARQYELKEFVFTGELVRKEGAKTLYTVTDKLRENTNSALGVLDKIPFVTVSAMTDKIKISGSENILVLVNGRKSPFAYAKNINPARIATIEIEPRPQGRWEGYDYLINIVLKKNFFGYDTGVSGSILYNLANEHSNTENLGADLTFSSETVNLYGTLGWGRNEGHGATSFSRTIGDRTEASRYAGGIAPNIHGLQQSGSVFIGSDYKINNRHTLSLQASWNGDKGRGITSDILTEPMAATQTSRDVYHSNNYSGAVFYDADLSKKVFLSAEVTYNYYHARQAYDFSTANVDASNLTSTDKNYLSGLAYLFYGPTQSFFMNFTEQATYRTYRDFNRFTRERDYLSDEFRNSLQFNAVYSFGSKLYLTAGVKWTAIRENTTIGNENDSRTHMYMLPTARVVWNVGKSLTIDASYGSGLSHPNFKQLSATVYRTGEGFYRCGNPLLKPQSLHSVDAAFHFLQMFKLQYAFRKFSNYIDTYYTPYAATDILQSLANGSYHLHYVSLSFSRSFFRDERLIVNLTGSYQRYGISSPSTTVHHGRSWYADFDATYFISPVKLFATVEFILRHDKIPTFQGEKYSQNERLMLSLRRPFLNSRLMITVMGNIPTNILDKMEWTRTIAPGFSDISYTDDSVNQALVMLQCRYTFGNGKSKSKGASIKTEAEKIAEDIF